MDLALHDNANSYMYAHMLTCLILIPYLNQTTYVVVLGLDVDPKLWAPMTRSGSKVREGETEPRV